MIRVLIDRHVKEAAEEAFFERMRAMRAEAVHRPGYVSGETLRDVMDHRHCVVVSTWRSREDWDAWAESAPRGAILEALAPLLVAAERVTVLEPV